MRLQPQVQNISTQIVPRRAAMKGVPVGRLAVALSATQLLTGRHHADRLQQLAMTEIAWPERGLPGPRGTWLARWVYRPAEAAVIGLGRGVCRLTDPAPNEF